MLLAGGTLHAGPSSWPVRAIGTSIATVLTQPFSQLVAVLLYFDLRVRKEGFDLEILAKQLGLGAGA